MNPEKKKEKATRGPNRNGPTIKKELQGQRWGNIVDLIFPV